MRGKSIKKAQALLEQGHVVAIPTETVYGLAANVHNAAAVQKVYEIKGRPATNPLIIHTDSLQKLDGCIAALPPLAKRLAAAFWPGPLTLLLPKKDHLSDLVTAGLPRVGVRIPNHPLTAQLLQLLPFPLAAPSANPSNYISPTTAAHVQGQLGEKIPYILDGGPCLYGLESTIIGIDHGKPTLYRPGALSQEAIEAIVGPLQEAPPPKKGRFTTPGSGALHYAPATPLLVGNLPDLVTTHKDKRLGVLNFQGYTPGIPKAYQVVLSRTGNLEEAARRLFAGLHTLDKTDAELLIAPYFPNEGLGRVINERLAKASKTPPSPAL